MKYKKRPIVIEAIKWDCSITTLHLLQSMGMGTTLYSAAGGGIDDWKLKLLEGEHSKPDIFEQAHELIV